MFTLLFPVTDCMMVFGAQQTQHTSTATVEESSMNSDKHHERMNKRSFIITVLCVSIKEACL